MSSQSFKIFVTGTRGIPDIPGGVESHCQHLYPLIVAKGHKVMLSRRDTYIEQPLDEWHGVKLVDVFAPRNKSLEAIIHTVKSIFIAKKWGADIVHIHAVGPAIVVPIARLLGLTVVFTNHGPDYDREKWGRLAKLVLRLGEKIGGIFANEVVVISNVIGDIIQQRCGRQSNLIYNGVIINEPSTQTSYIHKLALQPGKYILAVARFVPEKGLHDLIQAFNGIELGYKLVLAGDSDHEDDYSLKLKNMAAENPNIILTGYITGEPLHQLYSNAGLFVLPSYHEGLPIALLEALSYGITPLVSDIPANLEVKLDNEYYFNCKDIVDLQTHLKSLCQQEFSEQHKQNLVEFVRTKYQWDKIADQTISVYKKALEKY
ncbi:MAG: glycosyltransferase family 4 protein [Pseudomonadota bacterium]